MQKLIYINSFEFLFHFIFLNNYINIYLYIDIIKNYQNIVVIHCDIVQIKIKFYNYDTVFTNNLKRIQFLKKIYF